MTKDLRVRYTMGFLQPPYAGAKYGHSGLYGTLQFPGGRLLKPAYGGRKSTCVQPTFYTHTLFLSGADNPASWYHPRRFCLWKRE